MADLMLAAVNGRMPFDQHLKPRWKVCYEDLETAEEKEVTIISPTLSKACVYVQEEYGDVLSIERML